MLVYSVERIMLYVGTETISVWKTIELAEKEVMALEDKYGGQKGMNRYGISLSIKELLVKE